MHNLQPISDKFGLGKVKDFKLMPGKINVTYLVETQNGKFIIQKLSSIYDERIVEKNREVSKLLVDSGLKVPKLIPTTSGDYIFKEAEEFWRVFEYIDNDGEQEINVEKAREGAEALATFHNFTAKSDFIPQYTREEYQNLELTLSKLQKLFSQADQFKKDLTKDLYDATLENIEKHRLPEDLPKRIIHADPAFRNFLFKDNKVVAIIDLDDVMIRNHMIDIGHALQSWCLEKPSKFLPEIFHATIEAYNDKSDTKYHSKLYIDALCLLTLDHVARYLNDVFEENYFEWDHDKYSHAYEHNLERSKGRMDYYFNIVKELQ